MNRKILVFMFLLRLSTGTIKIDRDVSDTLHGVFHCGATPRADGYFSCTCRPEYKTFMSSQDKEYDCRSLTEVGCEYNLQDNDQAFLVTEKNLVRPIFTGNITKNNLTMAKVLVWNYDGNQGSWNDITRETERLFKVDEISGKSTLHISNLTLKAMAGHAVKMTFEDAKCLVFKFKGTVEYGFDLDEFKKRFEVKPTKAPVTSKPLSSTTSARTATTTPGLTKKTTTHVPTTQTTERKSTAEKVTSTSKPKITTQVPTSPTTERKSTAEKVTSTSKPKITTQTPTKNGTQSELVGSHVKSNIIYTVVSIAIVIAFGVAIFFVYKRRRKQNMNRESNQKQEMSSRVNKSYEPDTCQK